MSGITGIFYRDGRFVDKGKIKKMNDVLSHRGPDGSNVWCEGSVAMGHQMLWTTPESLNEKLPFEEDDLIITADSRIDNRKELSDELRLSNAENVPDSYYILKSYEKWGEDCPEKLLGDFSFVIWDKKKQILFCARDHMGVKPFYYYFSDEAFYFASEIKSLLELQEISVNLNSMKVADHLVNLYEDKEITFYEGIYRLPAANSLTVDFFNKFITKYWELDPNYELKLESDEEYARAFLDIFTKAVECRLRSSFEIGSLLSGGLDSTSVVCVASKILSEKETKIRNTPLKTFSATFEDTPECDEQYYINKVIKDGKFEPYVVKADQISPLSQIDKVLWHLDEPFTAPNLYFHWHLHQKAKEKQVRIVLEGLDGDTTVSHGYKFELDYFRNFRWLKCFKEIYMRSKMKKISLFNSFLQSFLIFTSKILSKVKFNRRHGNKFRLLNKNLVLKTDIETRYQLLLTNQINALKTARSYHFFNLNSGIIQYALEIVDKSAAASSLEARYPFFDRRLVEFCLSLPIEQKINNGWDRIIMRRAMENIIPKEVQWRSRKTNLGLNYRKNLILYEKNFLDRIINNCDLIGSYVDCQSLKKLYEQGILNNDARAFKIFGVITMAIWLNNHFKHNP